MMKVTGIEQASARLLAIDTKVATSIGKKAVRAGAKIVLKVARAEAPSRSGLMRKSLAVKAGRTKREHVVRATVGLKKNSKAFYYYFLLRGWHAGKRPSKGRKLLRLIAGRGDTRKFMPPNAFIERAYAKSQSAAAAAMGETLVKLVNAENHQ